MNRVERVVVPGKGLLGQRDLHEAQSLAIALVLFYSPRIGKGLPVQSLMGIFAGLYTLWICVHLLGLIAAWMVRMYAGHRREGLICLLFLACLPMIATATVIGQHFCLTIWPLSACTLAVMIVMATADFGLSSSTLASGDASS